MKNLPHPTLRLFPSHAAKALARPESRPFVVARLLEEGDREDLRWLASQVDEADLARWVRRRGERQLSRRSLAFWSRLLAVPVEDAPRPDKPAGDELWPL